MADNHDLDPHTRTTHTTSSSQPLLHIFSKTPPEWLHFCRDRAALFQRQFLLPKDSPAERDLLTRGFSPKQAKYYLRERNNAIQRKLRMLKWHISMPPSLYQSFGVDGDYPHGLRIPIPPPSFILHSLPAKMPNSSQWPQLPPSWLQQTHSHSLDSRITFQEQGHLYFLDGKPLDLSVTGLLDQYAEARSIQISANCCLKHTAPIFK